MKKAHQQLLLLRDQLQALESEFPFREKQVLSVSNWSVGNHLEHLYLAHLKILARLKEHIREEKESGNKITMTDRLVLFFGYIPRGRGNAPEQTRPKGCSDSELKLLHAELQSSITTLLIQERELEQSRYAFSHPMFGLLSVSEWLWFVEVHTKHHLKIIHDIRSKAK